MATNFEKSIRINRNNRTIKVTKSFDMTASRFGSHEYKALQQARKDYPDFTIVVKSTRTKTDKYKGLTYEFMEKYIKAHDVSLLPEFYTLIGKEEEDGLAIIASYGEVRQWFLSKFDVFSRDKIDAILGKKAA